MLILSTEEDHLLKSPLAWQEANGGRASRSRVAKDSTKDAKDTDAPAPDASLEGCDKAALRTKGKGAGGKSTSLGGRSSLAPLDASAMSGRDTAVKRDGAGDAITPGVGDLSEAHEDAAEVPDPSQLLSLIHTHTHTLSLSISISLSHTLTHSHAHTHAQLERLPQLVLLCLAPARHLGSSRGCPRRLVSRRRATLLHAFPPTPPRDSSNSCELRSSARQT